MDCFQSTTLLQLIQEEGKGVHCQEEDYIKSLLKLSQNVIQCAASLPSGIEHDILASISYNEKTMRSATKSVSSCFEASVEALSSLMSREEGGTVVDGANAPPTCCYETFSDCVDKLLLKAEVALRLCKESGTNATMGSALSQRSLEIQGIAEVKSELNYDGVREASGSRVMQHTAASDAGAEEKDIRRKDKHDANHVDTLLWKTCFPSHQDTQDMVRCFVKEKFHSRFPLPALVQEILEHCEDDNGIVFPEIPHLYEQEIHNLDWESPDTPEGRHAMYEIPCPEKPRTLEETPLVWVKSVKELNEAIKELKTERLLALDVEHHSEHSFIGCTCLIQISSRVKDYLIDPLKLRKRLWLLNEIFADPGILKVLHGASMDVIWLQRDFSLYLVNIFDTSIAARSLNIPGGASLGNLLFYYCEVNDTIDHEIFCTEWIVADKKYQLADWRRRPLTDAMIRYGRTDTHYLLYVHECLRRDILQRTDDSMAREFRMSRVLQESRMVSLQTYSPSLRKPVLAVAEDLLRKFRISVNRRSTALAVRLLEWRERLARTLDEARHSVLSNVFVGRLVSKMPTTWIEFGNTVYPLSKVLHSYAHEILDIIKTTLKETEKEDSAGIWEGGETAQCVGGVKEEGRVKVERETAVTVEVQEDADTRHDDHIRVQECPLWDSIRCSVMSYVCLKHETGNGTCSDAVVNGLEKLYGIRGWIYFKNEREKAVVARVVGKRVVMDSLGRKSKSAKVCQETNVAGRRELTTQENLSSVSPQKSEEHTKSAEKRGAEDCVEVLEDIARKECGKRRKKKSKLLLPTSIQQLDSVVEPHQTQVHVSKGTTASKVPTGDTEECPQTGGTQGRVEVSSSQDVSLKRKSKRSLSLPSHVAFLPTSALDATQLKVPTVPKVIKFFGSTATKSERCRGPSSGKKRRKFGM